MTVIWFSSGFKWAAFGYIALPTTYLSRHIVWDSFLLFWVYRREWLCCWFISIQFIHYLLFLHWTYFYWIFVVLSTVLVTGGKKMIRPYCNPKETVEMGSHTSCCIARLGRNIKCCVKMSQPEKRINVKARVNEISREDNIFLQRLIIKPPKAVFLQFVNCCVGTVQGWV